MCNSQNVEQISYLKSDGPCSSLCRHKVTWCLHDRWMAQILWRYGRNASTICIILPGRHSKTKQLHTYQKSWHDACLCLHQNSRLGVQILANLVSFDARHMKCLLAWLGKDVGATPAVLKQMHMFLRRNFKLAKKWTTILQRQHKVICIIHSMTVSCH